MAGRELRLLPAGGCYGFRFPRPARAPPACVSVCVRVMLIHISFVLWMLCGASPAAGVCKRAAEAIAITGLMLITNLLVLQVTVMFYISMVGNIRHIISGYLLRDRKMFDPISFS